MFRLPAETTFSRRRALSLLLALTLCALGLGTYWPGLSGGFIFDDIPNLVRSDVWKVESLEVRALWGAMTSDISGAMGRPLAMLSFAFNHAMWGEDPFALKLGNLFMHLANGALVFGVARVLLRLARPSERGQLSLELTALLLAAAWLVHPLQVSTVLYVVQRMEIGAATGILSCLLAYVLAREKQLAGQPAAAMFALSALGFLLGLGFKESALVAPLLVLMAEALLLRFQAAGGKRSRALMGGHLAWFLSAAAVYLLVFLPGALDSPAYAARGYDAGQRLLSQGPVLVMYLGQILLPLPESMAFYYDHLQVPANLLSPPRTTIAIATLAVLAGLALAVHRRWPLVALGIGWFFACHSLTSNVIPLELAFEHRNYLALFGPLLALHVPVKHVLGKLHGDAAFTAALVPVGLLAVLCIIQTNTWADPFRLAAALAGRNPDSSRASYEFGTQLHARSAGDPGNPLWTLAQGEFEHASRLTGSSSLPEQALLVMAASGRRDPGEVLDRWQAFERKFLDGRPRPDDMGALHSTLDCGIRGECSLPDAEVARFLGRLEAGNPYSIPISIMRANHAWNALGDKEGAISILRAHRARNADSHAIDLALAEMLMASNLHTDSGEVAALLAGLKARDIPPEARGKVRDLELLLRERDRTPRQP